MHEKSLDTTTVIRQQFPYNLILVKQYRPIEPVMPLSP